jgi:hypothetical protein
LVIEENALVRASRISKEGVISNALKRNNRSWGCVIANDPELFKPMGGWAISPFCEGKRGRVLLRGEFKKLGDAVFWNT